MVANSGSLENWLKYLLVVTLYLADGEIYSLMY
jgi:hypothetical protein